MNERIVVLDGYTLNPGDIDWQPLRALGDVTLHDRTSEGEIVARASGASCLMLNKTPLSRETLESLPDLRYVGVLATGYNVVDTGAAVERGIVVTNIATYDTDSVTQHVAALLLEFARGVAVHDKAVHDGEWTRNPDWCFAKQPMFELTGKTLGIVGLGRIGRAVARVGAAFGMELIAHDLFWPEPLDVDVEQVEMDALFARADVVTLHCPLTAENNHLVDAARLSTMKANAILINTSRGPLVDNQALADALNAGTIAGAGLDVLDTEPPPAGNPLLGAPNCIITPHIAWYAREARQRLMQIAADNLRAFLAGEPVNTVT